MRNKIRKYKNRFWDFFGAWNGEDPDNGCLRSQ